MEDAPMENQPANGNKTIRIFEAVKLLDVERSCIDGSAFNDVSATKMKIVNANLSGLEIEGAQIGGAFIHNIGLPPKGHPMYVPGKEQKPVRFEDCDLHKSSFTNCNLSGIEINDCDIDGLKINGILVAELLRFKL